MNAAEFAKQAEEALSLYDPDKDSSLVKESDGSKTSTPQWFIKVWDEQVTKILKPNYWFFRWSYIYIYIYPYSNTLIV